MIRKALNTLVLKIGSAFFNLLIAIMLSNCLGASGRGVQSLLLATISIIVTITGLFGSAPLSFLYSKSSRLALLWVSYLWALVLSLIVLMVISYVPIVPYDQVWHVVSISCISSLGASNLSLFLAKERISAYNLLQALGPFVVFFWMLLELSALGSLSVQSYIRSLYLSNGLIFIISFYGVIKLQSQIVFVKWSSFLSDTKAMFRYGFFNQTAALVQMISYRGNYYLIGWIIGESAIGVYSNAIAIAESIWLIPRSIALVLYSKILNVTNERAKQKIVKRALAINALVQLWAITVLALIPEHLYVFLFGNDFGEVRTVILWLLPSIFLYGQTLVSSHYFSGTGRHYINMSSNLTGMMILIGMSSVLIPVLGLEGAAISTILGYGSLLCIQHIGLRKHLGIGAMSGLKMLDLKVYLRYLKKKINYIVRRGDH
ncbi:MAG: polysaccharide biosynthesis C-terminal domain-containing protein [Breznakibacter sp.]